ncbi:N-acetyllactosaminide 3-alpha-galactosyltransferase [Opisthorchis viverrini]|uniref:Hexosyltransferase n=1 Tax=Opisthorchis viverrini TaxID=6198 RepID=A0A1S8WXM2_OPIVI|nr:N-acetyllactosaminide 3-alpha-galactosyltransferase [Opisthorchis viverrini]
MRPLTLVYRLLIFCVFSLMITRPIYTELPLNDRDFPFLINQPELCTDTELAELDLILLIRTECKHRVRRNIIRRLWANSSCWGGMRVKHVFLLGKVEQERHMNLVEHEARQYRDMVQQDFLDTYRNITYKFLLGLQWTLAYCSQSKWLLFVDDDFFVNPRQMGSLLQDLRRTPRRYLILGSQHTMSDTIRDQSKWGISKSLYPFGSYPNFLSGGSQLIGAQLALDIYISSRFTNYFPLDDVFTGLILNKLMVTPVHSSDVVIQLPSRRFRMLSENILTLHSLQRPSQQRLLWWKLGLSNMCKPASSVLGIFEYVALSISSRTASV